MLNMKRSTVIRSIMVCLVVLLCCNALAIEPIKKNIRNKIVLVTGASGEIGKYIVKKLYDAGYSIIAQYNRSKEHIELFSKKSPNKCILIQSDFSNPQSVLELWKKSLSWKGRIDCLINCAGKLDFVDINSSDKQWYQTWKDTLQVNLIAPSLLCKKACQHFLREGQGIIINISSRTADNGYPLNGMHYAASKAGLKVLSKSIAVTYGANNILSYTISPGCVDTKMVRTIDPKTLTELRNEIPTKQFVDPIEIADLVEFICSGKIKNATGASFDINGASYLR